MNRNETLQLLGALKALDPQGWVTVDDTLIQVWTAALSKAPAIPSGAAMATALEITSRPNEKFPTPGDFRSRVAEVVCKIPSPEDARRQIELSMKRNYPGMPATYTPDRIVLDAVREIGGVHVFRVSQSDHDTRDLWRRFVAKYQELRADRIAEADIAGDWTALSGGDTQPTPALAGQNGSVER